MESTILKSLHRRVFQLIYNDQIIGRADVNYHGIATASGIQSSAIELSPDLNQLKAAGLQHHAASKWKTFIESAYDGSDSHELGQIDRLLRTILTNFSGLSAPVIARKTKVVEYVFIVHEGKWEELIMITDLFPKENVPIADFQPTCYVIDQEDHDIWQFAVDVSLTDIYKVVRPALKCK